MQVFVGTSGYQYKAWKGGFYEAKCKESEMLLAYSKVLNTVEVNNTFYRMPKREVLQRWAGVVPENFRFAIKAPQRLTHVQRLKLEDDSLAYFVRTLGALGDKLGVVLFQLPPYLRKDVPRLAAFLDQWPKDMRCSFEFRHESWNDDEVLALLRAHDVALCTAEIDDAPSAVLTTASFGYLRLRREHYEDAELAAWAARISALPASPVYVYFKHEDQAPFLAQRLRTYFERPGLAKTSPKVERGRAAG